MSTHDNASKDNILFTAIGLIKEKGYEEVTINEICKAAGVAKNTFYYYFKTKDDLLLQYYNTSYKYIANIAAVVKEKSAVNQYWMIIDPILDFIVESGHEVMKHILYVHIDNDLKVFNPSDPGYNLLDIGAAVIERAQASGEMRNTSSPHSLIEVMQCQLLGAVMAWCTAKGRFDIRGVMRLTAEVCFDIKPELRRAPEYTLKKIWEED